tara:strand:- start:169 stop:579 length:411 start_codon:yes stop_codon:yes gene_type:complete
MIKILTYGNGQVILNADNIVGIQIDFKGKINCKNKLNNTFNFNLYNNRIVIFGYTLANLPNFLFEYTGEFRITSVKACDRQVNKINIRAENIYLGDWKKQNTNWEVAGNWDDLKNKYTVGSKVIKQKNILTEVKNG